MPGMIGSWFWGGGTAAAAAGSGGAPTSAGRSHLLLGTLKLMTLGIPTRSDITSAIPRVGVGTDQRRHTDFSERDTFGQNTWHHGRGQDEHFDDPEAFSDADELVTWIPGQVTLPIQTVSVDGETSATIAAEIEVSPDANPEVTTFDGYHSNASFAAWATNRDAATSSFVSDSGTTMTAGLHARDFGDVQDAQIPRTIMLFDLSAIPAGATIVSADLVLDCVNVFRDADLNGATETLELVAGAATAPLTGVNFNDYNDFGTTSFDSMASGEITAGATSTFALNASGLTHITTAIGGVVKLGIRSESDRADTEPTIATGEEWKLQAFFATADTNPAIYDPPRLIINYTVASASTVSPLPAGGVMTDQERFEGNLYALIFGTAAADNRLYVWDNTATQFDLVSTTGIDTTSGEPNDLHVFGGNMYVAQGETVDARRFTGSAWSDNAFPARFYETFDSKLWRSDNLNELWYSTDPENDASATWTGPGLVGTTDYPIRGMFAGFDGAMWVGKDDGLYSVRWDFNSSDYFITKVIDLSHTVSDNNGQAIVEFGGNLYFSVGHHIYRYDGNTIQILGPERGLSDLQGVFEGGLTGHVHKLTASSNYLIAAVGSHIAGDNSFVALWSGTGWHIIARSTGHIGSVFHQSALTTTNLLEHPTIWWSDTQGDAIKVQKWPRFNDDPLNDSQVVFDGAGTRTFTTSWYDAKLPDIDKSFLDFIIEFRESTVGGGGEVYVFYQLDDENGDWDLLGNATITPTSRLKFPDNGQRFIAAFGKRIRYRIQLVQGTSGTPVLRSWAHRFVVRPDSRYGWNFTVKAYDNHYDLDREPIPLDSEDIRRRLYALRDTRTPILYQDGSYKYDHPDAGTINQFVNPLLRLASTTDAGFAANLFPVDGAESASQVTQYKMFDVFAQEVGVSATDALEGCRTGSFTTSADTHVRASAFVFNQAGNSVFVQLYNVTDGIVVSEVEVVATTPSFYRYVVFGLIESGDSYQLRVVRKVGETTPTATTFFVDGIQVLEDATTTDYDIPELIHGESPRSFWLGDPHNSKSQGVDGYYVYITAISEAMRYIEDLADSDVWNTDITISVREMT